MKTITKLEKNTLKNNYDISIPLFLNKTGLEKWERPYIVDLYFYTGIPSVDQFNGTQKASYLLLEPPKIKRGKRMPKKENISTEIYINCLKY